MVYAERSTSTAPRRLCPGGLPARIALPLPCAPASATRACSATSALPLARGCVCVGASPDEVQILIPGARSSFEAAAMVMSEVGIWRAKRVGAESLRAEYVNGVLRLTIPVAERAKPRRIEIGRGGSERTAIEGTATRTES